MRVNVYAEELTDRVEIVEKEIDGRVFTGVRFWLELPVTTRDRSVQCLDGEQTSSSPVFRANGVVPDHVRGPFLHGPGDDDSSAVTFWGKRDLRVVLQKALDLLADHYRESNQRHCGKGALGGGQGPG